jgi:hypothetical protein
MSKGSLSKKKIRRLKKAHGIMRKKKFFSNDGLKLNVKAQRTLK